MIIYTIKGTHKKDKKNSYKAHYVGKGIPFIPDNHVDKRTNICMDQKSKKRNRHVMRVVNDS